MYAIRSYYVFNQIPCTKTEIITTNEMELNRTSVNAAKYPSRILQFGEGNFLRAFVDWIVQKMNNEIDFNTGIDVVQPLPNGMIDLINKQDVITSYSIHYTKLYELWR